MVTRRTRAAGAASASPRRPQSRRFGPVSESKEPRWSVHDGLLPQQTAAGNAGIAAYFRGARNVDPNSPLDALGMDGLMALQRTSGNAAVGVLVARDREPAPYPWIGRIEGAWTASLRATPEKRAAGPHRNTVADLPRGTEVRVTSAKGGWLHVDVKLGDQQREGYVSQELVSFVRASAFELNPIEVRVHVPTITEAFLGLKRAESRIAQSGRHPTDEEREDLELAASVLERTGKYTVDQRTWTVDFKRPGGERTNVYSIEDFILFAEAVERAYWGATPKEVASEIRETWYADPNWAVMLSSQGIRKNGKLEDIETRGPIFEDFDMKQIAPNKKGSPIRGLKLQTPMGLVDLSHVMAGIDATLSAGMAKAYPEPYLEEREKQTGTSDYDTYANTARYELLKETSGGDTRDFATWSGDLGQVYAEFIFDRYILKNKAASLAAWTADKMPREQLLGDIHGYVAMEVFNSVPAAVSPTGSELKVSNILRNMYLAPKSDGTTLERRFAAASNHAPKDLAAHIEDRVMRFARLWFANKLVQTLHSSPLWPTVASAKEMVRGYGDNFDGLHAIHVAMGKPEDQLSVLIGDLLKELRAPVR